MTSSNKIGLCIFKPFYKSKHRNGESKYYFPDLYIPHKNLIIEVKSTWTYQKEEEKNQIKAAAARENGYEFEFWIFDSKGVRVK